MEIESTREPRPPQEYTHLRDPLVGVGRDEEASIWTINLKTMTGLLLIEDPEVLVDHERDGPADYMTPTYSENMKRF
jgi:hypothetical protein